MERNETWDVIVAERSLLAARLSELGPASWDADSLCAGWRVRDVAAHLIAGPQLTWGALAGLLPQAWRGYNGLTLWDGRRRGSAPVADILAQYERWGPARRGPAVVTHRENLIDTLVHTQDMLRPLGIEHVPPARATAAAARWVEPTAFLLGGARVIRSVRMIATDADFDAGRRPVIEAPMIDLLMLRAGRAARSSAVTGPGRGRVRLTL